MKDREGDGTPLQYSCLENPMDGGAWYAAVHGVAESRTWLSNSAFTFHFHALKKEMATHSSVLAWRIPGTGEPGGLMSMGSDRVRHDWSDLKAAAADAGDARGAGSISGSGRSLGVGNGNPFQYSCPENSMDGGARQATVHGITKSRTQLSTAQYSTDGHVKRPPCRKKEGRELGNEECKQDDGPA